MNECIKEPRYCVTIPLEAGKFHLHCYCVTAVPLEAGKNPSALVLHNSPPRGRKIPSALPYYVTVPLEARKSHLHWYCAALVLYNSPP